MHKLYHIMTFPVTVFDFSTFLQGIHRKDRQSSGGGYQVTCGWWYSQSGEDSQDCPVPSVHPYLTGKCGKTGNSQPGF